MPLALVLATTGFHVGLVASAYWFGFRHGIDWDHIAALTDITGAQQTTRRSLVLATLYALGHALVVFVLGVAAVVLADELPDVADRVMERVVGVTLIVLGVYVIVALIRHGREFRMRSRWMLLIAGARRLMSRSGVVVIEHDHEHALDEAHGHVHTHVHAHAGAGPAPPAPHRHLHQHIGSLPDDPFGTYAKPTAFAVGLLHGIGAETPTQVLIFATAAGAGGNAAGLGLLVAFVVGLLSSNTLIALAATFGFLGASSRWPVYATVSLVTAVVSLVIGSVFLFGSGDTLPSLFTG